MFGYLRIIVFIGLLAISGAAAYAWWLLPDLTTPPLVELVERGNTGIAQGYINAVWNKHRDALLPIIAGDPAQMKNNPEVLQFAQDTAHYFKNLPIHRANIYMANGTLLFSMNGGLSKLPGDASPDAAFVTAHKQSAGSNLLPNGQLQTMLPIRIQGVTVPEGALEIISNLAQAPDTLIDTQLYGIAGIASVSLFFFLVLLVGFFFAQRKSEAIITKQHETNIELLGAVAAAQAENRDKSQFLANVSHELRTPLNAIIGFSEIIKNEVATLLEDKKYQNYISDIHAAGVHLLSLINDILDYSKAEAGKLELEVSEVNATKLIQNSMRLVGPRAESGQIKLVEKLPKDALIIHTDSKKFKQVLLNLLSNAVKFTQSGGEVTVTAWYNVADDTFTFEVRDSGIGIAPKDISRAMAPFSQVDNTLKRKYEGTGLGLPLTKKFVELMDGKFTIESEVGKGTTITFTLPRHITPREGLVIKQET